MWLWPGLFVREGHHNNVFPEPNPRCEDPLHLHTPTKLIYIFQNIQKNLHQSISNDEIARCAWTYAFGTCLPTPVRRIMDPPLLLQAFHHRRVLVMHAINL